MTRKYKVQTVAHHRNDKVTGIQMPKKRKKIKKRKGHWDNLVH